MRTLREHHPLGIVQLITRTAFRSVHKETLVYSAYNERRSASGNCIIDNTHCIHCIQFIKKHLFIAGTLREHQPLRIV